jgi:ArsR family metal-binding transcriptional regulator
MDYVILSPCVTAKTRELRMRGKIDLGKAEQELSRNYEIVAKTDVFLSFVYREKPVSLYSSGKIIVRESEGEEAKEILKGVFSLLEERGCLVEG